MIGARIKAAVEASITNYHSSRLKVLVDQSGAPPLAIKYVLSKWAAHYSTNRPLKISGTPALTWGTGTYVAPLVFPLSSALYGRIGVVTDFDPVGWRIFDATDPAARLAYLKWAQAQANFEDLVLTVHSTFTNHALRNKFRKDFSIDCVLFHPDQEAELHTDKSEHVWMLVTDWLPGGDIDTDCSSRLANARFTVLIDEEFDLHDSGGLPIRTAKRKIEATTLGIANRVGVPISHARGGGGLAATVATEFSRGGYVHVYVEP